MFDYNDGCNINKVMTLLKDSLLLSCTFYRLRYYICNNYITVVLWKQQLSPDIYILSAKTFGKEESK